MLSRLHRAARRVGLIVRALPATMTVGGGLLLFAPVSALGAPPEGFPLQSSEASPVTGAVTISASAVQPEPGLLGVQFKVNGHGIEALDATAPFQVVWSAASASDGEHTISAEARYSSGAVIESAPLVLTVANPTTFNRLFHVDAAGGNDGNNGLTPSAAWRTLGRANAAVAAGDTVRLRGTFNSQRIAPNVSGTAAQPIRFTSYPGETAVLNGDVSGVAVWLEARSYVVVEGLRIQNVSGYAVLIGAGGRHNVVRGCTITNTSTAPDSWGNAVRMFRSSDNLVEGNQITNVGNEGTNSGDSIIFLDARRNRVLNNTILNGGHSLIQVSTQNATQFSLDNVVAGNTLSNVWTTPVILSGMSARTLVEANRISDGARNGVNFPRPGIQLNASDNIIRYNEVFNNRAAGIHVSAYSYQGWFHQDSNDNQIYHNVFYGNGLAAGYERALWISERDGRSVRDNLIANNIFFRNNGPYMIQIEHYHNGSSFWPVGSLNGNRIQNNIFLRQPGSASTPSVLRIRNPQTQGPNLTYTLSAFQQTYAEASSNLESDPLFTDQANRVFTLRAGSPAIDRGMLIPGVDYLGAAPDLGAHEFVSSNPVPTLGGLSPSSTTAGSPGFTLTVNGSNFVASSVVRWNGADRTTTFVSGTQLTAAIPSSDVTTAGTAQVTVFTPAPGGGTSGALPFTVTAAGGQSPYPGASFAVPGLIEAEDFDNGGEGVAWHDLSPGNQGGFYRTNTDVDIVSPIGNAVGAIVKILEIGEWVEYAISVAQTGTYRLEARVSSEFSTSRWHAEIDGVNVTGSVAVPNTGSWGTFQWVGVSGISLTAGQHVLRIHVDQQYFDLDALRVVTQLVAAYSLNPGSGGTALDSSGDGKHGTIFGATWTSLGRYGNGLSFDGVDDRVRAPSVTLGAAFTIMAWIHNPSNGAYETIVTVGTNRDLFLRNGVITFYDGTADRAFGNPLALNVWHHVAVVSDGSNVRVYLNGAPLGTPLTVSLGSLTGDLQVGAWIMGGANYDFFAGRIDEVRLYSRALTQAEVQTDMSGPIGP